MFAWTIYYSVQDACYERVDVYEMPESAFLTLSAKWRNGPFAKYMAFAMIERIECRGRKTLSEELSANRGNVFDNKKKKNIVRIIYRPIRMTKICEVPTTSDSRHFCLFFFFNSKILSTPLSIRVIFEPLRPWLQRSIAVYRRISNVTNNKKETFFSFTRHAQSCIRPSIPRKILNQQ